MPNADSPFTQCVEVLEAKDMRERQAFNDCFLNSVNWLQIERNKNRYFQRRSQETLAQAHDGVKRSPETRNNMYIYQTSSVDSCELYF